GGGIEQADEQRILGQIHRPGRGLAEGVARHDFVHHAQGHRGKHCRRDHRHPVEDAVEQAQRPTAFTRVRMPSYSSIDISIMSRAVLMTSSRSCSVFAKSPSNSTPTLECSLSAASWITQK